AAQMIERHDVLRDHPRPPAGKWRHERADPDPLRAGGDGAERDPRGDDLEPQRPDEGEMVPEEHRLPAPAFPGDGDVDEVGDGCCGREVQCESHASVIALGWDTHRVIRTLITRFVR